METGSNKAAPIATANENVHIHKLQRKKEIAINICIESEILMEIESIAISKSNQPYAINKNFIVIGRKQVFTISSPESSQQYVRAGVQQHQQQEENLQRNENRWEMLKIWFQKFAPIFNVLFAI